MKPSPAVQDEIERVALCPVKYCPAPNDPDAHICPHCQSPRVEHQHIVRRSKSKARIYDPTNIVMICSNLHRRITTNELSDAVLEINGERVYRVWDIRNNTICECRPYWMQEVGDVVAPRNANGTQAGQADDEADGLRGEPGVVVDDGREGGGAAEGPGGEAEAETLPATTVLGEWSALELLKQFVTPTGCNLPANMPYDLWLRFMGAIGEVHMASEWTVGDGYLYGAETYGENEASQGEAALGREPKRLANIVRVCSIIPPESRLKGIRSFSVFEVIAPVYFREPETGLGLLQEAAAGKWTGEETKAALDARGLRPKAREKAEPEPAFTLPLLRERFAKWPERVTYRNNLNKGMAAFLEWLS